MNFPTLQLCLHAIIFSLLEEKVLTYILLPPLLPPPPGVFGWDVVGGALKYLLLNSAALSAFTMAWQDSVSLPTLKLLLVGDSAVGKTRYKGLGRGSHGVGKRAKGDVCTFKCFCITHLFFSFCSLLLRFTDDQFEPHLNPTIGEHSWLSLTFDLPSSSPNDVISVAPK